MVLALGKGEVYDQGLWFLDLRYPSAGVGAYNYVDMCSMKLNAPSLQASSGLTPNRESGLPKNKIRFTVEAEI